MAFRAWALEHPSEFALLFDVPSDGPAGGCDPSYEIGSVFLDEFAGMWRRDPIKPLDVNNSCEPPLDPRISVLYPDLSSGHVLAFLRVWTTVCGLVMLEVNGHLGWLRPDGGELFEIGLAAAWPYERPSASAASPVPRTRAAILANAVARDVDSSSANGENPQSSQVPSRSGGTMRDAASTRSLTSSGVSTRGSIGSVTPAKIRASGGALSTASRSTSSGAGSLASCR